MSELRWNPLLRTYTMVAANRQNRPHLPKDWCPFCIGSGKVPDNYDVYVYPNDYPVLSQQPVLPIDAPKDAPFYHKSAAHGKCEVILYSPDHQANLYDLSVEHITKLVQTWTTRFVELRKDKKIKYIFPFENRGEEVGVTMPHPHGQLYAYPFVPLKIKTELDSCRAHHAKHGECLICAMNRSEQEDGRRMIAENEHFVAYLPFFTDYPFGVFIVSKEHKANLADFTNAEQKALAEILKSVTGAFSKIYGRPFPYMMCLHQTPVNTEEYANASDYYHFHIEFYPPLRAKNKIKWYASSEMGAWAAANVVAVEESAKLLRAALTKWQKQ